MFTKNWFIYDILILFFCRKNYRKLTYDFIENENRIFILVYQNDSILADRKNE